MRCANVSLFHKFRLFRHLNVQKRHISANEAAVALRPFYFAVHPDRFAREPHVQMNNEKALQVFNGYLNNLFPRPGVVQAPVQIEFMVKYGENQLKSIRLILSGADADYIIRNTLEKCELGTEHLPAKSAPGRKGDDASKEKPSSADASASTSSKPWSAEGLDEIWQNLQKNERIRRKQFSKSDFFKGVAKSRRLAIQRMESHRRMAELIRDEIEDIQRRTGVTQVLWSINWELSFMRRCLLNVQAMISHAESDSRENIIHALNGRKLNFGRGSYICCDGSLQFGADDATGAWQRVCLESAVRRFDVKNLELLVERVRELLAGAQLNIRPLGNLLHTIQYMQIFIGRVCSQPKSERLALKSLLGPDQQVEIVNSYCELVLLDGCIQIPCNVDIASLKHFLQANSEARTGQIRREHFEQKCLLESAKGESIKHLGLTGLSWDADLHFPQLLHSLRKLRQIDPSRVADFSGLEMHLSSSPKLLVLTNGKIAVPIEWIEEI